MRANWLAVLLAGAAALVAAASGGAARIHTCPARSIGPGALSHGGTAGAQCMLRAYGHGCTPSTYELSSFGVDTVATMRFRVARRAGTCEIDVARSFRVVPQQPHTTGTGRCKRVRRTVADIVATGCVGSGTSPTTSLTH